MGLPQLRQELALHVGPRMADGQPSWILEDPVRSLFFRLDWLSFEILSNWAWDDPEKVADAVRASTTLDAGPEDVLAVREFIRLNQLARLEPITGSSYLAQVASARKQSWILWLIHNYLFFRVPLAYPNRWLQQLIKPTAWIFTRRFVMLSLAVFLLGIVLVYRQWDAFQATLVDSFTPAGLASYGLALLFVKVLHELGHGVVARRYGCHVPAMGVAFMVMWPVPYTDVNDAWKLADKRARALIGSAGVLTELTVAIWATLAWALLEDGHLRAAVFLLATTTWVSTLVINLSPFMRFDGYFVLSDLLEVPNMHQRSFALARWRLREWLFSLGEPPPEHFPPWRARGLIFFAWFTWIYRLILFLGIAVLVYAFFVKAIGILLFAIEIIWFVLMPIYNEVKTWRERWPAIRRTRRSRVSAILALLLVAVLLIPIPWTVRATGILHPGEKIGIFAPEGARIEKIEQPDGSRVEKGTPLFTLSSDLLTEKMGAARSRLQRLGEQVDAASVNPELRSRLLVLQADLEMARANMSSLRVQMQERRPLAPHGGIFRLEDPDLRPGVWVARNEQLGSISEPGRWYVESYISEQDLMRLKNGMGARFYINGHATPLALTLSTVESDASRALPDGTFSRMFGGSVNAREDKGTFVPEQAAYRITLETTDRPPLLAGQAWRGSVVLYAAPESLAVRAARSAMSVVWREAGW